MTSRVTTLAFAGDAPDLLLQQFAALSLVDPTQGTAKAALGQAADHLEEKTQETVRESALESFECIFKMGQLLQMLKEQKTQLSAEKSMLTQQISNLKEAREIALSGYKESVSQKVNALFRKVEVLHQHLIDARTAVKDHKKNIPDHKPLMSLIDSSLLAYYKAERQAKAANPAVPNLVAFKQYLDLLKTFEAFDEPKPSDIQTQKLPVVLGNMSPTLFGPEWQGQSSKTGSVFLDFTQQIGQQVQDLEKQNTQARSENGQLRERLVTLENQNTKFDAFREVEKMAFDKLFNELMTSLVESNAGLKGRLQEIVNCQNEIEKTDLAIGYDGRPTSPDIGVLFKKLYESTDKLKYLISECKKILI